jgi:hypothetical protein
MTDYRHHHAVRDVQVVLVPVPYEIGSPKEGRRGKPGRYPSNPREPWRPATRPPNKAERLVRFLEDLHKRTEDARSMLRPDARLLAEWVSAANF